MECGGMARETPSGAQAMDPLARPVWSALTGRHSAFSVGGARARRMQADVGPFAATCDDTRESLAALAALAPDEGALYFLQEGDAPTPPGLEAVRRDAGVQMIAETAIGDPGDLDGLTVARLSEADAPAMRALAALTQPGPFLARTHRLGAFWGVMIDGRLAAMASERMRLVGYTEVSGVCTHPAFRGRGLAGVLTAKAAAHIAQRGETAFLHAYADNTAAIRVYERLGFRWARPVTLTEMRRG